MGCNFELGDDFEKCEYLIDEYEDLLIEEQAQKKKKNLIKKNDKDKEDLKFKIKEMLEYINKNVDNLAQIDKLQRLNEKYQVLLAFNFNINIINNNNNKLFLMDNFQYVQYFLFFIIAHIFYEFINRFR